ncbi:hypothetical protein ACN38_g13183, partial [Penicillium nordicum]
YMAGPYSRKRV